MFSISTAPAKQSVGETITVLSGRLSSATLLEDRRAAILGLRSFAKDFPASVASGALRGLIGSLSKDGGDVDTIKVILETLLMLFNPNEESPEASEDIALWLADEFTQRQENVTILLDFLETADFYSRLYSLQLLSAILSARAERTEESVFTAPLGISRLVAVLDDRREPVRNEAINLLVSLTPSSADIQKLVAFQGAFEKIFSIIRSEGSLEEGGRVVEDCLILLANLLRKNVSNQSLFRESGCVAELSAILEKVETADGDAGVATWAETQRNRNIYALLAVVRLFLLPGSIGTIQSQAAFWQHKVLYNAIQLAFRPGIDVHIRAEALITCGDIIRSNSTLQENFAQLTVPSPLDIQGKHGRTNGIAKVYVIDGLLDLTLGPRVLKEFDVRLAACECLKAYFSNHMKIRLHFLERAVEGHKDGKDETANVLTVLLQPPPEPATGDPYRQWFAATIMLHLLIENPEAKAMAMSIVEGDETSGEERVTSIQTITAHLITGMGRSYDPRVLVAYLMVLLVWLFEDLDAVDDFLDEGSNVQGLIQAVVQPNSTGDIVRGLCAMLLGVVYEFSTKDSPIPRAELQPVLTTRMGRDRYLDVISKLRSHPFMRDFEVLPQRLDPAASGRLPDVYFDGTFVEFFKDNYSRMSRTLDRDPGIEISVVTNGIQKGISRELVDSLRTQIDEGDRALQDSKVALANTIRELEHEQAGHRRTRETTAVEVARMKQLNEALQRQHDAELRKIRSEIQTIQDEHKKQMARAEANHDEELRTLEEGRMLRESQFAKQIDQARKAAESETERLHARWEAEKADFRATISRLDVDLMKARKSNKAAQEEHDTKLAVQLTATERAEIHARDVERRLADAAHKLEEATPRLAAAEEARRATQNELDDLLMVFGDLEEKVLKYRGRLVALGEAVSDGEEE